MNPSIDIKVTTEIRHAKASKSGLTVATTTTPGKLSFYHSISFWASEIKEARRLIKTFPPYKWACRANALELTYPKVYYQTKGGNDANIWIKVHQHQPNRYGPNPMEDNTGHYNIKVSFEADFISSHVRNKQDKDTTAEAAIGENNQSSSQSTSPTQMQNHDTQTDSQTTACQATQTDPQENQTLQLPITAEVIEIAKEEAFEIQIENFIKISDDLHLTEAMYKVALKFIDPINALTHEREARGRTKQYKHDFILQSKMFQANIINYLRRKPITPSSVDHIHIDVGQQRLGEILKNPVDIKTTFMILLKALNYHTYIYTSMFDYTHALSIISCMPEEQRTQPIAHLRMHFEENIICQVQQLKPIPPELPQTDNAEVDYLPNIINKIRARQLIPHIHKLAHNYKQACTNRPSGNPPQEEFLKMFHNMMKDKNKYDINYDPLTKEEVSD
jgi:hypothetical protein